MKTIKYNEDDEIHVDVKRDGLACSVHVLVVMYKISVFYKFYRITGVFR